MEQIILSLDAPWMSFGGPAVDRHRPTNPFPGQSLLTGLLGNALGYDRRDNDRLQQLQEAIAYAARIDQEPPGGIPAQDFQTARLGPGADLYHERGEWVIGWTTRGEPATRAGSPATYEKGGHQRQWRDYRADTKCTIALNTGHRPDAPDAGQIAEALRHPARTLFIGRKPCLPAGRIYLDTVQSPSPLQALLDTPLDPQPGYHPQRLRLQWDPRDNPVTPAAIVEIQTVAAHDLMDWNARVHTGRRNIRQGAIPRSALPRPQGRPVTKSRS